MNAGFTESVPTNDNATDLNFKMSKLSLWREMVNQSFRKKYNFPPDAAKNWFPGHMHKGLKDMQRRLTDVDCVIEVHDARIPLSGRNTTFKETISGVRPHILVLNKEDLIPREGRDEIVQKIKSADNIVSQVVFTHGRYGGCHGMKSILPSAIKLIEESNRYHRAGAPDKTIIIIGIPNVGKSTIINQLRHRHMFMAGRAAAVGSKPGVTKVVQEKIRVCDSPRVYLLDTPGISKPNIRNINVGMKLAACNTLNDRVIGQHFICDYLLWYMNLHHQFDYVDYMELDQPEDDVMVLLSKIALVNKKLKKQGTVPDLEYATEKFLKAFRHGAFGRINLDADLLDEIHVPHRDKKARR